MYNMKHNLFPHERSTSLDKHDKKRGSSNRPRDKRYHRIGSPARDRQYFHRSKSPVYRRSRSPKWNERYYDSTKSPERDGRYRYHACSQIPLQDGRSYISRSPIRKESYHYRSKSSVRDEGYLNPGRNSLQDGSSYISRSPIRKENYHYRSKSSVRDEGYLQDGSSYISRSPVQINPDEFYEKSSVGECDVGNFNTFSKIGHEESDRSISGYSEKKATDKMIKDGSKENGNCSSSCINEKAINSVSKGESKDESVNSITRDINENVKSSKKGRTGTEDKSIDKSSVIVNEDCISSCSNKMSNDYFEKRNIHEDVSDVSDTSLNDDMQKQSDSETTVINAENMVCNETEDIEIIQELYKQNDQLVDVHNLVKTESKELTYSSLERSLPGESMTDECFGRKIPTEAMKTIENYENEPVSLNCNEQVTINITVCKDESKDNCGIRSESDIISNNEKTSAKNNSHLFTEGSFSSPVDKFFDARVQTEASQFHANENSEKEQQVIDNDFLDQSTFSENIDVPCSIKECSVRVDEKAVSMDIEVTQEIPIVNELFSGAVKTEAMVTVNQKEKQITENKIHPQNQGAKNVITKDTESQGKEQRVQSNEIEDHCKFIEQENPYQLSFHVIDGAPSSFKKCCVMVDGNWYTEMKKKEVDQRGFNEPIFVTKNAASPLSRKPNTCLKKPVPKNLEITKISLKKPVHKIPKIAKTSIMKSVLKNPEIAKHGLTELEHQKDKIQDKKPEIEVEEKFYNNCEVTKVITKVLKVEPVMCEDETTDQIGGMKILPCSDCPRSFSNASTIVVHREVHSGTSIMNCNDCTFTGNRKAMLMHTRAKHTGEKLFECDFCKKRFASCASKKSHEKKCS